jgi:hypothetical protein
MSNISPFGPIPPKKPKAKSLAILINQVEVYGWIDADSEPIQGTEIFSVDESQNYCIPPDDTYSLLNGDTITTYNGVIQ